MKLETITAENLAKYKKAQELKVFEYYGCTYEQNKYSYGRFITSGLDERIYTFIADNEDKFFGKENENVKDRKG